MTVLLAFTKMPTTMINLLLACWHESGLGRASQAHHVNSAPPPVGAAWSLPVTVLMVLLLSTDAVDTRGSAALDTPAAAVCHQPQLTDSTQWSASAATGLGRSQPSWLPWPSCEMG